MMNIKITILTILICLLTASVSGNNDNTNYCLSPNTPIRIAFVHSYDIERSINQRQGAKQLERLRIEFPNRKMRIRSYYLNANHKLNEKNRDLSGRIIADKIKEFDPHYILVFDDHALADSAIDVALKTNAKIFLFCMSETEYQRTIQKYKDIELPKIYGSLVRIDFKHLFSVLSDSRFPTQNIYFLNDGSEESLSIAKETQSQFVGKNISYLTIRTKSELKKTIFDLQRQPKGIIISSIHVLFNDTNGSYLPENEIFKIINKVNKRHFETSLRIDSTQYGLCSSMLCSYNSRCETLDLLIKDMKCQTIDNSIQTNTLGLILNESRIKELGYGEIESNIEHIEGIIQ